MLSTKYILEKQSSDYTLGYADALSDVLGELAVLSGAELEKIKDKLRAKIEECDELI